MDEFLQRIEEFLTRTGMSATNFGLKSLKNPRFVFDLRKGSGCTLTTVDKVNAFMSAYTGGEVQPNDFYKGDEYGND